MKRSNRLVLLVGVFLAIVAFVGILLLSQDQGAGDNRPPQELPTVVAKKDIPLGTRITSDQVTTQVIAISARDAGAYEDVSQVIGKVVRQQVVSGAQITSTTFGADAQGQILDITCPAGLVCMSVQVDQVTGVGTVIKTGDYVDMVVGFTGDKFPVITANPADDTFTVVSGLNSTSVKAVLQGMQVLGTLLPPAEQQQQQTEDGTDTGSGTALTGQQQIVILAVTTQQSEVIKFAQVDGNISLVLRSPDDFIDPVTGDTIAVVPPVETTGVILKTLVDTYGVLPPELVETVLPEQ